jgi:thymidylate kinase
MFLVFTGLDGAGKTGLIERLTPEFGGDVRKIHLPHDPKIRTELKLNSSIAPADTPWEDRKLFAEDNRLASKLVDTLVRSGTTVLSQRGWMDSFIHGRAVGYDYDTLDSINRVRELRVPDASIYLVCDPAIAWQRVKDDPTKDRWETPEYLAVQYQETITFYDRAAEILGGAFKEPRYLLDTSYMTPEEVKRSCLSWLGNMDMLADRNLVSKAL